MFVPVHACFMQALTGLSHTVHTVRCGLHRPLPLAWKAPRKHGEHVHWGVNLTVLQQLPLAWPHCPSELRCAVL
jgi:hypothetical protein